MSPYSEGGKSNNAIDTIDYVTDRLPGYNY